MTIDAAHVYAVAQFWAGNPGPLVKSIKSGELTNSGGMRKLVLHLLEKGVPRPLAAPDIATRLQRLHLLLQTDELLLACFGRHRGGGSAGVRAPSTNMDHVYTVLAQAEGVDITTIKRWAPRNKMARSLIDRHKRTLQRMPNAQRLSGWRAIE